MPPDPRMRAADSDRDRVVAGLREHCAQGRLTIEELNERLEAVYAAKTLGELQELTADLPEEDLHELPVPARQWGTPARRRSWPAMPGSRALWATWASVSAFAFITWAIVSVTAGRLLDPWWLWVAGPWGVALLVKQMYGGSGQDGR